MDGLAPHLTRDCLVTGKSTVPVGTAARLAARIAELAPAGGAAGLAWNPEFLREGFAVEDTLRPDRIVVGIDVGGRRRHAARDLRQRAGAGHAVHHDRSGHGGTGQGGGERLPGHQDLLHQRGRQRVRRGGGGRDDPRGRARPRHPDRPPVPVRRARLRRRLPVQGHPGLHGPRRRTGRGRLPAVPPRGGPDQHGPAGAGRRGGPGARRRVLRRAERGRAGGRVQARHRRRPRLARPGRGPDDPLRGRGRAGARSPGHLQRPPGLPGPGLRRGSGQGLRGGRRGAAPHRMARVPRRSIRWSCFRWSGPPAFSTGATCCRWASGRPRAGPCARWVARSG